MNFLHPFLQNFLHPFLQDVLFNWNAMGILLRLGDVIFPIQLDAIDIICVNYGLQLQYQRSHPHHLQLDWVYWDQLWFQWISFQHSYLMIGNAIVISGLLRLFLLLHIMVCWLLRMSLLHHIMIKLFYAWFCHITSWLSWLLRLILLHHIMIKLT